MHSVGMREGMDEGMQYVERCATCVRTWVVRNKVHAETCVRYPPGVRFHGMHRACRHVVWVPFIIEHNEHRQLLDVGVIFVLLDVQVLGRVCALAGRHDERLVLQVLARLLHTGTR